MASGITSNYNFPYPVPTDPVNITGDIQALAEALDNAVTGIGEISQDATALMITSASHINGISASYDDISNRLTFSLAQNITTSASPIFNGLTLYGIPTAPTAAIDTNTDQIATTSFIINQNYLKNTSASNIYLTQSNASATYITQGNASATYLTQSNASATYLTQANASATYLTQANASATYALLEDFQLFEITKDGTAVTGSSQYTFRAPFNMTLTQIPRALLSIASSSGSVSINITAGGSTIFSTNLSIDENEKTSTTANVPAVLSTTSISNDAEIIFDVVDAGTGAEGLKVIMYYKRT